MLGAESSERKHLVNNRLPLDTHRVLRLPKASTVFLRIQPTGSIKNEHFQVRVLFEGGFYSLWRHALLYWREISFHNDDVTEKSIL